MSEKLPVVIKNSAPHEVSFSEVTGKITRKVNRFNDNAAAEAGGSAETLHEQAGEAALNRQRVVQDEQYAPDDLRGEAGPPAGSDILHAAESAAPENRLHENGAGNPAGGDATPQLQSARPEINRQRVASALNAPVAGQQIEAGKIGQANILHEPVAGNQPNTVYAGASAAAPNVIVLPPAAAPVEQADGEGVGASAANPLRPAGNAAADPIANGLQTGGAAPNLLRPDTPDTAKNIVSIESGAEAPPNLVLPDASPTPVQNVLHVPLQAAGDVRAEQHGADIDAAPQPAAAEPHAPAVVQATEPAEAVDAGAAHDHDRNAAMNLKISAAVAQHMHTVEEETARLNRQLEKLGTQYARLEKRHK